MKINIPFNKPTQTGDELTYLQEALSNGKFSGDGSFNKKCEYLLKNYSGSPFVSLTPSCSASLEMAMFVCSIKPGDEVILPSYTFSSTANAILIAGGTPVFIDCKPEDMNINENLIEKAITKKTKAILPMHYAGAPAEMDRIIEIASQHKLYVISDAAQAILSKYKKRNVEKLGTISALSFHETKNISCGEGGAIFINDDSLHERAEIIREKGTNRKQFQDGLVDKYTWHEIGSSYLMNEFTAAILNSQLSRVHEIIQQRLKSWDFYHDQLASLENAGLIQRPQYPNHIQHNGHLYFIILPTTSVRKSVQAHLLEKGIQATTHYIPLHSAPAGKKYGRVGSSMKITEDYSERLLRLPMYFDLTQENQMFVIDNLSSALDGIQISKT
jgi:dTDP-4-amino-4,6-dideoxygalactose transaminase